MAVTPVPRDMVVSCSLCGHIKVGPRCLASLLDLGQLSGARDEKGNIKLTLDSYASGDRVYNVKHALLPEGYGEINCTLHLFSRQHRLI